MAVCQKFASSVKATGFLLRIKRKWMYKALFIILRYRENSKIYVSKH